jgi:hypothetical protein
MDRVTFSELDGSPRVTTCYVFSESDFPNLPPLEQRQTEEFDDGELTPVERADFDRLIGTVFRAE